QFAAGAETLKLWTRTAQDANTPGQFGAALVSAIHAYDSMFGTRNREGGPLWLVECPVVESCFSGTASGYTQLISGGDTRPSAEMASRDTVMVELSSGNPELVEPAGPSLASSWLGYGQNPGFFEQTPPLSALPAFAAARGREAGQDPQVRRDPIRRTLRAIPLHGQPHKPEDAAVLRAKSLLFFYGLQDLYGQEAFKNALRHMLYARRGGGFDLDD